MGHARKKVLVDTKVQGALARRIAFHWAVFFLLSLLCLFAVEYFTGDPNLGFQAHLKALWSKYAFFVLLMISIVPSFVYDALKMSNRFAGPMVRLRDGIRKIADGEEVPELRFRDGDFWGDVAGDFNRMSASVGAKRAASTSQS